MNLKTRFILLVIGITVIPILVAGGIMAFQLLQDAETRAYPEYWKAQHWIRDRLPRVLKAESPVGPGETVPEYLDVVVIDNHNSVYFSSIPEFSPGRVLDGGALLVYVNEHKGSHDFQMLSYDLDDAGSGLLVVQTQRIKWYQAQERWHIGLVLPLTLLLFSSGMSFSIVRSTRNSIQTLERATRKIADGDLDFELTAQGNDEIASLTRSFDLMRQKVKEEYARRSRFIMGVSHDLKTPLALIEGYVDAIRDGYADNEEKLQRYLAIIKEKSDILEGRITHLLDFVKLETGEWETMLQKLDIRQFFQDLGRRFGEDVEILGYDFNFSLDLPDGIQAQMDPDLVTRAFENIVNNAARYADKTEPIEMKAQMAGSDVVISIANYGKGISDEEIDFIFDPFFRGSNSRREEGFGLGLATVRSIIRSHGWDITVHSEPGGQTLFAVRINVQHESAGQLRKENLQA